MVQTSINSSARKWIFLAVALSLGLVISAIAGAPKIESSPTLPQDSLPTSTIFNRVCDWIDSGGGEVPANLSKTERIYPMHVAVCLIVANRDKVPASEKARIAQISGLTSVRQAAEELDKFIPGDKSIVKLRTSFDLSTFDEQATVARMVIADELRQLKEYPKSQHTAPDLAQNQP